MAFKIISEKFSPMLRNLSQSPLKSVKNYCNEVPSMFRQNFSPRTESQLNLQISQELHASHSYLAMANFFARTEIALNGSAGYFRAMSNEERMHAFKLIDYQNIRGGRVTMHSIDKPKDEFNSLIMAFEHAISIERNNTDALMNLVDVAEQDRDFTTVDFIVAKFLNEQASFPSGMIFKSTLDDLFLLTDGGTSVSRNHMDAIEKN